MLFSPDGRLLAAIVYDKSDPRSQRLRLWDTETGAALRDMEIPYPISDMAFSPDGKRLTMLSDGIIYVMGIKEGE